MHETPSNPESMAMICQCGSTEWVGANPSRTAVAVTCARCGVRSAAKSFLKATSARGERVVAPTGEDAPPTERAPSTKKRITVALDPDAHRLANIALLCCRLDHGADDRYCGRTWASAALEAICADYLAGADRAMVAVATEQYDRAQPAPAAPAAEVCYAGGQDA